VQLFKTLKHEEVLPKGELFHIQNPLKVGKVTKIPQLNIRVNDFWVEYEKNQIHQFYSNLSILNNFGKEVKEQTISVNNPLRYKGIDFYQSDWNLIGIRVKNIKENKIIELPLFPFEKSNKIMGNMD
jgi:cytochrome c biogenesis protein